MALPMTSFNGFLVDADGAVITNALITVTNVSDDELSVLYSDSAGEIPISNPIDITYGAKLWFYIDVGVYKIDVKDNTDDTHKIYELTVEEESTSSTLYLYENIIRNMNGMPISDGFIRVMKSDGSLPSLYGNDTGTIAAKNPFPSNEVGEVSFYLQQGVYDFLVTSMKNGTEIFLDVAVPTSSLAEPETVFIYEYTEPGSDNNSSNPPFSEDSGTRMYCSNVWPGGSITPNTPPFVGIYDNIGFGYVQNNVTNEVRFVLWLDGSDGSEDITIDGDQIPSILSTVEADYYAAAYGGNASWMWVVDEVPSGWDGTAGSVTITVN
jgi:hypothetical protein